MRHHKLVMAAVVVLGFGLLAGVCGAVEEGSATTISALEQLTGRVTAVDVVGQVITVTVPAAASAAADETVRLAVTAATVLTKGSQTLTLSDLHAGDAMMVSYTTDAGQRVARSIVVHSAPEVTVP